MKKPVFGGEQILLPIPKEEQEKGERSTGRFPEEYHGAFGGLVQGVVVAERIEQQTEESLIQAKN